MKKTVKGGFESQLRELEEIVKRLEDGSTPLEESLQLFERGVRLSRDLQKSLQEATLRVTRLLEAEDREVPFEEDASPEENGTS
ncbi:MAG: exodeoxyribonuclease VII small subunit [Acidobacteriota bacterium]